MVNKVGRRLLLLLTISFTITGVIYLLAFVAVPALGGTWLGVKMLCHWVVVCLAFSVWKQDGLLGRATVVLRFLSLPLVAAAFWNVIQSVRQDRWLFAAASGLLGLFFLWYALVGREIRNLPRDLRELRAYLAGLRRKFRERREWKKAMRRPK